MGLQQTANNIHHMTITLFLDKLVRNKFYNHAGEELAPLMATYDCIYATLITAD